MLFKKYVMAQFEHDISATGHTRKVYQSTCEWRGENSYLVDYSTKYFIRLMDKIIPKNFDKKVPMLDKCGKVFYHNRANVKYCSSNCRVKHYQLRVFSKMLKEAFGNTDNHFFERALDLGTMNLRDKKYNLEFINEEFENNPKLRYEAYRYFHFAERFLIKNDNI